MLQEAPNSFERGRDQKCGSPGTMDMTGAGPWRSSSHWRVEFSLCFVSMTPPYRRHSCSRSGHRCVQSGQADGALRTCARLNATCICGRSIWRKRRRKLSA